MAEPVTKKIDTLPAMEEPVTKKIDTLPAMEEPVATNDKLLFLDVSAPAATMTKLITMNQVRISAATQLDVDVVETAKIKDGAVTSGKLAAAAVINDKIANATITDAKLVSIDKTLLVRLLANDEVSALRTWTNEFLWPPSLNGLVIKEAYATLSVASSSGSVVVAVKNAGNTVTTLTVSQGSLYSPAGSINTSYRTVTQFQGCSFQITSAGTGAKGLSIILVAGRA